MFSAARVANEQDGARRIVGTFNDFIEQISLAWFCAEDIAMDAWEEAVRWCRDAVARNPQLVGAHYHLGSALIRLDRVEEALETARHATATFANDAAIWLACADVLREAGRHADAFAALDRGTAMDADLPRAGARHTPGRGFAGDRHHPPSRCSTTTRPLRRTSGSRPRRRSCAAANVRCVFE